MKDIEHYLTNKVYSRFRGIQDILGFLLLSIFVFYIIKYAYLLQGTKYEGLVIMFSMMVIPIHLGMSYFLFIHLKLIEGISSEYKIYSVNREKDIHGSFVLGCGSIDTVNYYYFYQDGDFGKKIGKVEVNSLEIIETNDYEPSIKEIMIEGNTRTFMFVPSKTIKQEFNL